MLLKDLLKEHRTDLLEQNMQDEETEIDGDIFDDDNDIFNEMYDLLLDIDPDVLTEEQAIRLEDIINYIETDYYEDEVSDSSLNELEQQLLGEATVKKVRRNLKLKRQRAIEYRKHRASIKLKAKKYRKTAKFKKLQTKAKRMAKQGKTALGKRKRKYLN